MLFGLVIGTFIVAVVVTVVVPVVVSIVVPVVVTASGCDSGTGDAAAVLLPLDVANNVNDKTEAVNGAALLD